MIESKLLKLLERSSTEIAFDMKVNVVWGTDLALRIWQGNPAE